MDKTTQTTMIKAHLISGGKITALDALSFFGCMRLSGRIHDLKREGLMINKVMKPVGSKKHVAEYSLSPFQ